MVVINKYLVSLSEEIELGKNTIIVEANNKEEALRIFYSHLVIFEEDTLKGYICSKHYGFARDLQNEEINDFNTSVYDFFQNGEYSRMFLHEYHKAEEILNLPDNIIHCISENIAADFFPDAQIAKIEDILIKE